MKKSPLLVFVSLIALSIAGFAADEAASKPVNSICPISGKPVDPDCTTTYEDRVYAFCSAADRTTFINKVESSIYHKIGGKAAMNAAVDLFYTKVLADERVNHFFEDVNMARQHNKQKQFLSAAFGSPVAYEGKDMRTAHKHLDLDESHFGAIAEHLQATLTELKVPEELIAQIMTIAASTQDDVLDRPKASN